MYIPLVSLPHPRPPNPDDGPAISLHYSQVRLLPGSGVVPISEQSDRFFALIAPPAAGYNYAAVTRLQRHYSEDHNMERAGERLKRMRDRLKLTYRDVEQEIGRAHV